MCEGAGQHNNNSSNSGQQQQQQQRTTQQQQQWTTQQQQQQTPLQIRRNHPSSNGQQVLAPTTEAQARAMAGQRIIEQPALDQASRCQPQ